MKCASWGTVLAGGLFVAALLAPAGCGSNGGSDGDASTAEDLGMETSGEDAGGDVLPGLDTLPGDSGGDGASTGNPGHTESKGGVMHFPGGNDPLKNCTVCHGDDLKGKTGLGPSCYMCHNNNDHTKNRDGVKHKEGAKTTCYACHGPDNSGGLGPACSQCH